jgi:hypothetical protein
MAKPASSHARCEPHAPARPREGVDRIEIESEISVAATSSASFPRL